MDDSNFALDRKLFLGSFLKVLRDRCYPVRLLNIKFDHLVKRFVQSHQRNVGAVKGGDRLQLLRTKHLLGQVGTGCVRDGVVRMDKIQSIFFAHVHQFGGQAEGVGWVF